MRIGVAGGGPAGLFFAALAAKSGHDVTLSERNARGATYGWGVVFSEGTLGALAEIDREVHRVIDERAVRWSAIEVLVGGQTVHSTGHGFSAVSRRGLLEALQEVCEGRSVQLRFEEEVDPADPFPSADLVVAADGVRSDIRELHRDVFRPELKPHPTRYVWYGTTLPLDAFTFVFEDTPAGLMQVHAYPYDRANSTFIVECTEEVWRGNGLDAMDEEASLLFCRKGVRRCPQRPPSALQPFRMAPIRHSPLPHLAYPPTGVGGRCRPHRPLLDRVGDQAGHGGRRFAASCARRAPR